MLINISTVQSSVNHCDEYFGRNRKSSIVGLKSRTLCSVNMIFGVIGMKRQHIYGLFWSTVSEAIS
jgi:hypothetical protein